MVQFLDRKGILINILDTAVWLWFHQQNHVSIHVLACAAHLNLHSIGKKNGTGPRLNKFIKEERLYHAYDTFRYPAGVAEVYEFIPSRNQEILSDAIGSFERIYGFLTPWMETLRLYFTIRLGMSAESPDSLLDECLELEALHQRFWDELKPEGPLEEMLVDQIVSAHWRLRRALIAESGEIALSVDGGHWKEGRGTDVFLVCKQWSSADDMEEAMQRTRLGSSVLLGWLGTVRWAIEREGALPAAAVQEFAKHFRDKPSALTVELENLLQKQESNASGPDAVVQPEANKVEALALIDERIEELRHVRDRCAEHENSIECAQEAAAVLPSAETLDRILRYETKLERQLYRAMAQLERVQRMRSGEAIPAPLSVEISDRG